jgi:hypothetical protein
MRSAAKPAHNASNSAIASNMPVSRSSLGRATTAARWARASIRPEAVSCRIASRTGVRDTRKRRAEFHLVERSARLKRTAHDLVGELKPQLLRERAAAVAKRNAHGRDLRC